MSGIYNGYENNSFLPIAIVGMGALFAGSENLFRFWENILDKQDCLSEVPEEFWDHEQYFDPDPRAKDKTYCKRGGFLPKVEFDTLEFGIPPKTAESVSLNQLLALKVAKDTLLDARLTGKNKIEYDREKVGVILGAHMGGNVFSLRERLTAFEMTKRALINSNASPDIIEEVLSRLKDGNIEWTENSFPGYLANVVSGRIANRFDFGGTNYTVDAACASSICAIAQSLDELHSGRCDIVLTGGVSTLLDPLSFLSFSKTPAFSFKNHIRPYDKDADGMLLGDGVGMFVLKRLEDAEACKDRIYAVITGIGSSSDGRAKSIYAPRLEGQLAAIKRAYEFSHLHPSDIGLIEGHGTGTLAGDACEIKAMQSFFGQYHIEPNAIALGSVKSQIGHTTQAAGAASAIKTALSLYHKIIPPMINFEQPHPEFQKDKAPFYISTQARPWTNSPGAKRKAAVSSFGFGGINYHLVMEEYKQAHDGPYRLHKLPQIYMISAPSTEQLISDCKDLLRSLKNTDAKDDSSVLSPFTNRHMAQNHPRIGFISTDRSETINKLDQALSKLKTKSAENWTSLDGIHYRLSSIGKDEKIVAMFSGQGAPYPEMGKEIALNFPELLSSFSDMDTYLKENGIKSLSDIVYPKNIKAKDVSNEFNQTKYIQPMLAAFCSGIYTLLSNMGFKPDICIGHSFGELTALWAASAISTQDLYRASILRGIAMQDSKGPENDPGAMLAVNSTKENIDPIMRDFDNVVFSNYNCPDQVVLSGSTQQIQALSQRLSGMKIKSTRLNVSGAFHSPFMEEAKSIFSRGLQDVIFKKPAIPVFSNLTGSAYHSSPVEYSDILTASLVNPVLFRQMIEEIYNNGARVFVEIGPKRILSNFVKKIIKDPCVEIISVNHGTNKGSIPQLFDAIARLKVLGLKISQDPYRSYDQNSPEKKDKSLNIVLKGRHYLTEETLAKMKKADEKKVSEVSFDVPINDDQSSIAGVEKAALAITTKQIDNDMTNNISVVENSRHRHPAEFKELIINNQIANSSLQIRYYDIQEKQLEVIDKVFQRKESMAGCASSHSGYNKANESHRSDLDSLMQYNQNLHQSHETFLRNQNVILNKLVDRRNSNISSVNAIADINPGVENGHENISASKEIALHKPSPSLIRQNTPSSENHYTEDVTAEPAENPSSDIEMKAFSDTLLNIVSESTGYPSDLIDLNMEIEADLGIDSIKRMEIFSAMHDAFPELSADMDLSDLGELKTLQAIIDLFQQNAIDSETPHSPKRTDIEHEIKSTPDVISFNKTPSTTAKADLAAADEPITENKFSDQHSDGETKIDTFSDTLLKIVSESTGYPSDLIDLNMEIEADLGIDSIKRMEIFSAMHDAFPDLSTDMELSDLGELKTLQAIIDLYQQNSAAAPKGQFENENNGLPADSAASDANAFTRFFVNVKPIGMPESSTSLNLSPSGQILIIDDKEGIALKLQEKLKENGHESTVLRFEEIVQYTDTIPNNKRVITTRLSDLHIKALEKVLNDIQDKNGPIVGLIHLNSELSTAENSAEYFDVTESKLLKTIFFIAKHLKIPLSSGSNDVKKPFLIITRMDGQMGMNGRASNAILQGGYFGLIKSLKREANNIFGRCIDIVPGLSPENTISIIMEELYDKNSFPIEIGRTSQIERYTTYASEASTESADIASKPDHDSVFLVTGGGRGITARCVEGLAKKFKSRFILVGRTSIEKEEPSWALNRDGESLKLSIIDEIRKHGDIPSPVKVEKQYKQINSVREVKKSIELINAAGGKAIYINEDITNTAEIRKKLSEAIRQLGKINGIIHGAGNLADKLLEKKQESDYDIVFNAKVEGLNSVLACIDIDELRYIVLFSSTSGYYGQAGQADYSLSNEILNKTAYFIGKLHPHILCKAINWGPWDGGMISPVLKRYYNKMDIRVIPVEKGVEILVNEFERNDSNIHQILVGPSNMEKVAERIRQEIMANS
ncbi:MAG: SDR family NAD(P)-dependent oxidoreductase [Desulfatitalea sp.]|nr:SDR family NAD(P)-dependent oxidoreductase [Desulfatitalea sp.]